MKQCRKCKTIRTVSDFRREKRTKVGLTSWCKFCLAEYGAAYYRANPPKKKVNRPTPSPERRAKIAENARKYRQDNLALYRQREAERKRKKRKSDPVGVRLLGRINASRRRSAEGIFTKDDLARIRKLQRGKCAYFRICGNKLGGKYHVDHIVPLSRGGTNWSKNIQLTCVSCNLSKNGKHPVDFAIQNGLLV